jgi:hypothetical protein
MVQRSLKKHRGKIGLSAQVEMAMPGDSLSISLAPGAQGSTKAVCPTLSNQDAMKIDQILRIVEDFSLFFAILTCGSHPPARFVNMNSSDSSKIRNKLDKSPKKKQKKQQLQTQIHTQPSVSVEFRLLQPICCCFSRFSYVFPGCFLWCVF